jgi:hypothetical protein
MPRRHKPALTPCDQKTLALKQSRGRRFFVSKDGNALTDAHVLEVASATGDIPQNVNSPITAAFLDGQHVPQAKSAGAGALSTPDIAERAKSFTVLGLSRCW